jgi:hypothetical protein
MKHHYETAAEWLADYARLMAARETAANTKHAASFATCIEQKVVTPRALRHSAPIPISTGIPAEIRKAVRAKPFERPR